MSTVREEWGVICPACRKDDGLEVTVKVWAKLSVDGTDAEGDHEWDSESPCVCACGWKGEVSQARAACDEEDAIDQRDAEERKSHEKDSESR